MQAATGSFYETVPSSDYTCLGRVAASRGALVRNCKEEKYLWMAVLLQGIEDYCCYPLRPAAAAWFRSGSTEVGSFRYICEQLGLDRDSVWAAIKRDFELIQHRVHGVVNELWIRKAEFKKERICECGTRFTPTNSRQIFCPDCGRERKKAQDRKYGAERRKRMMNDEC